MERQDFLMPREGQRTARIDARIPPEALAMVKRAAEIEGRSVSDFVIDAAQKAARKTIEETHIIRLAADDQLRFAPMLLEPAPLSPAMERARAAHASTRTDAHRSTLSFG
jgi:uncharacterized protein (DUF1778 family)